MNDHSINKKLLSGWGNADMRSGGRGQSVLGRVLTWLVRAELVVTCTALLFVAAALFSDVFAREAFGRGIFGAQKFAVYCNAIAGLLGFSVVVHTGGHLRVSAVDRLFPVDWHPTMSRLGDVTSAVLCGILGWFAARYVLSSLRIGEADLLFYAKLWPFQLVLPYIFLASAFKFLCFAICPALRPAEMEVH